MKPITKTLALAVLVAGIGVMLVFPAPAQQTEDQIQRAFPVKPGGTLAVKNHKGLIQVTGSDSNQVVVNVLKKFEGSAKDRTWWMANTQINFTASADRVDVSVEYPNCICPSPDWTEHDQYEASVELTIQVPRNINLDLQGAKPAMNVSTINGDIHITSTKSPIAVSSTLGAIHIETTKDTVRLKDVSIRGTLDVRMTKGEAFIEAKSLGDRVNLETEKGSIAFKAPQNAGMTLDYSGGRRSSFHSDFNIVAETGSSSSIRGTINGGGTQVHMRSDKGSVSLEKL